MNQICGGTRATKVALPAPPIVLDLSTELDDGTGKKVARDGRKLDSSLQFFHARVFS